MLLAGASVAPITAAEPEASDTTLSLDPEKVRLLDDIPGYAASLSQQWSGRDLTAEVDGFVSDTSHYGRLRELTGPQRLALADCIALALVNNTGLEISRLGPLGARAQVRRSYSIFDPSLFADVIRDYSERPVSGLISSNGLPVLAKTRTETGNLTGDLGLRKILLSGGQLTASLRTNRLTQTNRFLTGLDPQYQSDFVLSLNQPLLRDFGLYFTTLQVRIARTAERSALKQYEAAIADTIRQVEQAYWVLVQIEATVQSEEQGLALAKELERQNQGKYQVGAAPRTAVLEAQSEVARREAALIQAQTARSLARDNLRALINAPDTGGRDLLVVEPGDDPKVEAYPIDLEHSLATALERRPELAVAKLNVESAGMQLKIASNQLLPRLNAVGSLATTGLSGGARDNPPPTPGQQPNAYEGSYGQTYDGLVDGRFYSYAAGVTLEVPLSNIQARADYAQVRVAVEQARLAFQRTQEGVTLEVKKAVTNLQSDLKSIEATRIARELAEENLRNQQARYDVGLVTTKDLLDFQNRLTVARAQEVLALTTYNVDLAELRRVEGTLLEARNVVLATGEEESAPIWAKF
jgi:outer membrane protein TolC